MELYSYDAEASLIGAAFLDNEVIPPASALVRPEDMQEPAHRLLWASLCNLAAKGEPADVVTVADHLEASGQVHEVGGMAGIAELVRATPSASNAMAYAGVLSDLAQRRALIGAFLDLEAEARERGAPLIELASRAKGRIDACLRAGAHRLPSTKDALKEVIDALDRRFNGDEEVMGISTGITDLDNKILGLRPGLTILAARPSIGKTAMMLQWMAQAATSGRPVLCGSLEMKRHALMERLICNVGDLPIAALKNPQKELRDDHWPRITMAVNALSQAPLYIDDKPRQTVDHLRARAKEIYDEHGEVGLITVDYVQKMSATGEYGTRHDRAMEEVIVGLNTLGKEFNCPVVALSQLNREVEKRPNKRPQMSDLKESSAFEQEADTIVFLYRDEVYNPDAIENKGIAEAIIAKQREGEIGTVYAASRLGHGRFDNLASAYRSAMDS